MMSTLKAWTEVFVSKDENTKVFPISDLEFAPTQLKKIVGQGFFSAKLSSSSGPLISDYVTHESSFEYTTFGIHVGQNDRLTFMGQASQVITGYFIDCRLGSKTVGRKVKIIYNPSMGRVLTIPRGVAHTFEGLEHIVTRDEPVWYSDVENPAWEVGNDLVSFSRMELDENIPRVPPNRFLLPDAAHVLMSMINQEFLKTVKAYFNRFLVKIGGEKKYVSLEPRNWIDQQVDPEQELGLSVAGLTYEKNRYLLTGKNSYTLVPTTGSCVSDVLLAIPNSDKLFHFHHRTARKFTFLNYEGASVILKIVDLRKSHQERQVQETKIKADPRMTLNIPNGVAYRLEVEADTLVRVENKIMVHLGDKADSHSLPPFGADLTVMHEDDVHDIEVSDFAPSECPDDVVRFMARMELESSSMERA